MLKGSEELLETSVATPLTMPKVLCSLLWTITPSFESNKKGSRKLFAMPTATLFVLQQ